MDSFPIVLSPGWRIGQPLSDQSQIVTVTNGAGIGSAVPITILSREIPSGARAYVRALAVRIVDVAAFDQLFFALRHDGGLVTPWHKISGEQFVDDHGVPIEKEFGPGTLQVIGYNVSGTSEGGANPFDVRVLARFVGYLLNQARGF